MTDKISQRPVPPLDPPESFAGGEVVAAARCPVDVSTYLRRHLIVVKHAGERQTFSPRSGHNHVEWVGGQGHYDLGYTAAGPRFRYIVAGERGAVEYVTLAGFPLTISYDSPQSSTGSGPCPAMSLKAPMATGRSSVLGNCAGAGVRPARTRRSPGALRKRDTPSGCEPCAPLPHLVLPGKSPCCPKSCCVSGFPILSRALSTRRMALGDGGIRAWRQQRTTSGE
jgi:hypothetical protein